MTPANIRAIILVGSVAVSPLALALMLLGLVSADTALSVVSVLFSVALVPGWVENFKLRRGWSRQSASMTASGLLSMSAIFLSLGLVFTGLTTLVSAANWIILTIQAFRWGPK